MTRVSTMGTALKAAVAAAALGMAAAFPRPALAHSDVSVQLNWGYPVVVYRTPYRHYDSHDHYRRYDGYGRPVVVYHDADRPAHPHHDRGHGHHHRHDRYCRH